MDLISTFNQLLYDVVYVLGLGPVYPGRKIMRVWAYFQLILDRNSVRLKYRFTSVQAVSWWK